MRPGDIVKIKLSGDIVDAKVLDCRNKKTVWVEVLWSKTRIHALTPQERKMLPVAMPNPEHLSQPELQAALLALAGKKVVHQSGSKRIKIPRAKIIGAEPFRPQLKQPKIGTNHTDCEVAVERAEQLKELEDDAEVSKSVLRRQAIQQVVPIPPAELSEELLDTTKHVEEAIAEACEVPEEMLGRKPLSKLEQMKARIAAKKANDNQKEINS